MMAKIVLLLLLILFANSCAHVKHGELYSHNASDICRRDGFIAFHFGVLLKSSQTVPTNVFLLIAGSSYPMSLRNVNEARIYYKFSEIYLKLSQKMELSINSLIE